MNWTIKKISVDECKKVVDIHLESLPEDVLPSLGRNVLKKYYEKVVSDKSQMNFGAFSDDQLLGFCLLSSKPVGLFMLFSNLDGLLALSRFVLLRPGSFFGDYAMVKERKHRTRCCRNFIYRCFAKVPRKVHWTWPDKLWRSMVLKEKDQIYSKKTANEFLLSYYVRKHAAEIASSYDLFVRHYSEVSWAALTKVEDA